MVHKISLYITRDLVFIAIVINEVIKLLALKKVIKKKSTIATKFLQQDLGNTGTFYGLVRLRAQHFNVVIIYKGKTQMNYH